MRFCRFWEKNSFCQHFLDNIFKERIYFPKKLLMFQLLPGENRELGNFSRKFSKNFYDWTIFMLILSKNIWNFRVFAKLEKGISVSTLANYISSNCKTDSYCVPEKLVIRIFIHKPFNILRYHSPVSIFAVYTRQTQWRGRGRGWGGSDLLDGTLGLESNREVLMLDKIIAGAETIGMRSTHVCMPTVY